MDLRKLSYFVAVAETGHMKRAAERLHLSQPPLSRQIQALEDELGVVLFRRVARGMSLTSAGTELLQHARSILAQAELAKDRTRRVSRGECGRLDVGVFGSALFGTVPSLLQAFKSAHPEVQLALHHAQTPQQVDALRQGRVHLVFERLLPKEPDIEVVHVTSETLWLALAERHPLAGQAAVTVGSLAGQTLLIGSAPDAAVSALDLCRAHGFEPHFGPEVSDVVAATALASTGQGVTLVPESMTHVGMPGICYRPLISQVPAQMDLCCFFLRDRGSPLVAAMLEIVRQRSGGRPPAA